PIVAAAIGDVDPVGSRSREHGRGAAVVDDPVVAGPAVDAVVAGPGVDPVVAPAAADEVVAPTAVDEVVARAANQPVVARPPDLRGLRPRRSEPSWVESDGRAGT